jgi:hypothetical protein
MAGMTLPKPSFHFFQTVWHRAGGTKGMVRAVNYGPGTIMYEIVWDDCTTGYHYEAELSSEMIMEGVGAEK